jgi:hypothetical protein
VNPSGQLTIDRRVGSPLGAPASTESGERAARRSLRGQVARLERELSAIVADGFPHMVAGDGVLASTGPAVLGLGQLEQLRDQLAGRVSEMRRRAQRRAEHELRAQELLECMKLEPGRYKFVRLPVADLGQGGCGVWEVRPRFGLIGMLAGWWELTLSSGCPLGRGSRVRATPRHRRLLTPSRSHGRHFAWVRARQRSGRRAHTAARLSRVHSGALHERPRSAELSIAASVLRWRSVIEPTVFFSDIGICARKRRQRV